MDETAAFTGVWNQQAGEAFFGEFVIQVKHTTRPDTTLSLSDLADELDKAERLAKSGRCDVYLLMTSARVTGRTGERLQAALLERGHQPVRRFWLNLDQQDHLGESAPADARPATLRAG